MQNPQDVQLAATALKRELPGSFFSSSPIAIILGTGLADCGDILQNPRSIPFSSLPAFPVSSVQSHKGLFIAGHVSGLPVLIQCGRCHLYEDRSPAEICMGTRIMAALGCKTLIITNAAGALNPLFDAGSLMCIADIINHTGVSPLAGPNCDAWGPRFPDMSEPFDRALRHLALQVALKAGIRLEQGVYIAVHGPEMETPAETRMYRNWGADAVGMSTALEVIAARHLGMKILGISCLTNKNLPDAMAPAPLEEVVAMAQKTGPDLAKILSLVLTRLAENGPQ